MAAAPLHFINRGLVLCTLACLNACGGTSDSVSLPSESADSTDLPVQLSLPFPPLTPAPSSSDEPVVEAMELNNASGFTIVRDTDVYQPADDGIQLTDADFQAPPPDAIFQVPIDVDPTTNPVPYFENLANQVAVAGQNLEILFKPIDSDGSIPGMFPGRLPRAAQFRDNLDGSKSLVWLPLQVDVGIHEFTVTAIDSGNPHYRVERTIRIKVVMPEDASSIPNIAPEVPDYPTHTVRAGDAVLLELKATDPNGTVPTIEVPAPPAGATFLPHPLREEVHVLRFVPINAGIVSIDVIARDSEDASLTRHSQIAVEVLDANDFLRPGKRLRELAGQRNFGIGFAARREFYHRPDGALYASVAAEEFNQVTVENSLNMDVINPAPGRYQFADVDNLTSFAAVHGLVVHGPPLVWHQQLPDWILQSRLADRRGHMQEYIDRVLSRYRNTIAVWALVNEAIDDNGGFRDSIWFEAMGDAYIDIAFRQARQSHPEATLLLNDYDIAVDGPKADTLFPLLDRLLADEVPIDGVGFQMHIWSDFDQFEEVRANFQKVADRGLEVHVTELDVSLAEGSNEDAQARVYQQILAICLEQPACRDLQTWGFTDRYSWRRQFAPLLFDENYQAKPAYFALQQQLAR